MSIFTTSRAQKLALSAVAAAGVVSSLGVTAVGASVPATQEHNESGVVGALAHTPATTPGLYQGPSVLASGHTLAVNKTLVSPDGQYYFGLRSTYNCVRGGSSESTTLGWSYCIGTATGATKLVMQTDGNLVAYPAKGAAVWASGTSGHPGAKAVQSDDGVISVVDSGGATLWKARNAGITSIYLGERLYPGWQLNSGPEAESGSSVLATVTMTSGGSLVYNVGGIVKWSTPTSGHSGATAVLNQKGNLLVQAKDGSTLWASNTSNKKVEDLTLGNGGFGTAWTLSLLTLANKVVWTAP